MPNIAAPGHDANLLGVLSDHLNAEIAAGTVASKQDAMDYITWTYFFRRLVMNPSYYNLDDVNHDTINKYLSNLVEKSLRDLECSYCIQLGEDNCTIEPLTHGRIASYYYLKHPTVRMLKERLKADCTVEESLSILTDAEEYAELPVRHNEDQMNSELARRLPIEVNPHSFDSAHTKTHLLLQAHFSRAALPCPDYATDTKTVLDNAIRICQIISSSDETTYVTAKCDVSLFVHNLRVFFVVLVKYVIQKKANDEEASMSEGTKPYLSEL
ncbi:UNVERIFIED_CONTAM: hypothetical protein FKN15_009388 [Acipenser sinensis]